MAIIAQELGFVSGVSSGIQTQLDDRYTKTAADDRYALKTDVVGGHFTTGSISGSFGSITTSSVITGGELITGDITIGDSKIGYTGNNDLLVLTDNSVTVDGTLKCHNT